THSSGLSSSAGLMMLIPALLTHMSRRPYRSTAAPASACASAGRRMSAANPETLRPCSARLEAACSARPASRELTTTDAPSRANSVAITNPIPPLDPVTTATLPCSRPEGSDMFSINARHVNLPHRADAQGGGPDGADQPFLRRGGRGHDALRVRGSGDRRTRRYRRQGWRRRADAPDLARPAPHTGRGGRRSVPHPPTHA